MFKKNIFICSLFFVLISNAQNYIKHKVAKGETITQIALKYKVTPYDIYRINPDSQNGLKPDTVLLIPPTVAAKANNETKVTNKTSAKTHQVAAKETIYSITKQYGITEEELKQANTTLNKEGLKIGQILNITSKSIATKNPVQSQKSQIITHEVLAKETKYSIAKKYGVSVEELEKQNPEIVNNLPIGYKLKISSNKASSTEIVYKSSNIEATPIAKPKAPKPIEYVDYEIKAKETLYSLSKKFNISQDDLIKTNPDLAKSVQEATIIKVPSSATISDENPKKVLNFKKSNQSDERKKLTLLLPFNISKIQGDTIRSQQQRLKKDAFLNMTLDFYAGALVAIDSAKAIGLNIDVTILDSEETKTTSAVENLLKQNNLQNQNAIIGPFYQSHADKLAALLANNNVPVISPLSKDVGKGYKNMYLAMPSADFVKDAMFNYMRSKNGNIIAVVDSKKASAKQYITDFQKDVKFADLTDKGALSTESLKGLLVKDKMNYVVMESEKTGMIFATTNTLLAALSEYQIRLVILEPNDTLDFEEIALSRLTKLKLTYASLTRQNETPEAKVFENEFKKKNKIFPNQYATRGFDITFDTLMRLAQNKSFEDSINESVSEQVENKFDYSKRISGGYINKGVYILQYNDDLTISDAQ